MKAQQKYLTGYDNSQRYKNRMPVNVLAWENILIPYDSFKSLLHEKLWMEYAIAYRCRKQFKKL